jgi:hypothetical protein
VIAVENAHAAQFDEAGKLIGRAHQEPTAGSFQMDAIVTNELGKRHGAAACGLYQLEREPRFACA